MWTGSDRSRIRQSVRDCGYTRHLAESRSPNSSAASLATRQHHPETNTIAAIARLVPVAESGSAELGLRAPGPTTRDALLPDGGALRILLRTLAVIVLGVPVRAPLPDIAVH